MTQADRTVAPWGARVFTGAGIVLLLLGAAAYLAPRTGSAGDFTTFYYAAVAFRRGLNPYDLATLTALADGMELAPYLYPASTLAIFVPFTWLPLSTAMLVWLGLKLGLAAVLVILWWRMFARLSGPLAVVAMALFGFNAAMLMDLMTGNISILEELLLWLAFGYYVQHRRWPFALLVAITSVFKLTPIVFLALLFVPSKRHGSSPQPVLAGLALFGALVIVPPAMTTRWIHGLLTSTSVQRPAGEINPCALGMFDTLLDPRWTHGGGGRVALALWAIYCAALLVLSSRALRRAWTAKEPLQWVVVASMLFALLSPRMMIYSWILPVVPALLLVRALFPRGREQAIALAILAAQGFVLRALLRADYTQNVVALPFPVDVALSNLPFFMTLGLWLVFAVARSSRTIMLEG
jgi:hypothetical protein